MISYEVVGREGDAPWITLVHGFTQNRRYFAGALEELGRRYRVLLVDLRGHGASGGLPGPFGVAEHADDLAEVLDQEGIERTDLWATHTGTAVGLVLAVSRPALLEKMVLEGAMLPGYPMPRTVWLKGHAEEIARDEGVEAAMADWFEHADWFAYERAHPERTGAEGHRRLLAEFTGAPLLGGGTAREVPEVYAELGSLPQQLLVYNGEEDLPEYLEVASVLAESVPSAVREEIPEAGGFPLWENPRAVLRLVLAFLG